MLRKKDISIFNEISYRMKNDDMISSFRSRKDSKNSVKKLLVHSNRSNDSNTLYSLEMNYIDCLLRKSFALQKMHHE